MGFTPSAVAQNPPADPLNAYAKMVQLKGAIQQQQTQNALAPLQIQGAQQENQMRQMQMDRTKAMNDAYASAVTTDPNTGTPTFDRAKLFNHLAQAGQGAVLPEVQKGFLDLDELGGKVQAARDAHVTASHDYMGAMANVWKASNYDPSTLGGLLAKASSDGYANEAKQLGAQLSQVDPSKYPAIAEQIIAGSVKQRELSTAQTQAQARKEQAEKPTLETLSRDANDPDPTVSGKAKAALAAMADYQASVASRTATAHVNAENSPQAIAGAAQKAGAEANARIPAAVQTEVQKAQALAPKLDEVTKTMISGRKYVDLSQLTGPQRQIVQQQAAAAGIQTVDKDTASTLSDIDTARMNQKYMLDAISKKLPTGPGTRFFQAPENTLAKFAQTDPALASIGTYRSAAIQSMRAVAGSKGLRINRQEIEMAIDNDIPKMTDTLPTAQAKLKNMQAFLENAESAHLTQNRQTGATGQPNVQGSKGSQASKWGVPIQ